MKLTDRQKEIKKELAWLDRMRKCCWPPAREYFYELRRTPSKHEKRLSREFWAIAAQNVK